jgi:hypothetical protein
VPLLSPFFIPGNVVPRGRVDIQSQTALQNSIVRLEVPRALLEKMSATAV